MVEVTTVPRSRHLEEKRSIGDSFKDFLSQQSRLQHPSVSPLLYATPPEPQIAVVWGWNPSTVPLSALLSAHPRPLAWHEAAPIARTVAEVLASVFATAGNLYAGPLTPNRVFCTPAGHVTQLLWSVQSITYSPCRGFEPHGPPELGLDPGSQDARTDVYFFGLFLYGLLTGERLYSDLDVLEFSTHIRDPSAHLTRLEGLDPRATRLLSRAVAPRPADRFEKVEDMLAQL